MRRLLKELKSINADQEHSQRAQPLDVYLQCVDEEDLFTWKAWILGAVDTAYSDYYFELTITVPPSYPLLPPSIAFATKVFHPNVHFKVRLVAVFSTPLLLT
jgi:peroxin-4